MNQLLPRRCAGAILTAMLIAGLFGSARAQGIFQTVYGGNLDDAARGGVLWTSDGGYIAVGETQSYSGNGTYDVYVVKTDCCGRLQWARAYDVGAGGNDFGRKIRQTIFGDYIIVGSTEQRRGCCPTEGSDIFVMRIDLNGNVIWTKVYGGYDDDQGTDIENYNGGNEYVVVGYTQSFGEGDFVPGDDNYDALIMRLDINGNVIWARTYGGERFDAFYGVTPSTTDADIFATGQTASFGAGSNQIFVIRVDALGHRRWAAHYGCDSDEGSYDIVGFNPNIFGVDIYAIVGYTTIISGRPTPYVLKIFGNGACYCDRTFFFDAAAEEGVFREAIIVDDQDLLIAGYYRHTLGFGGFDALMTRVDFGCNHRQSTVYGGRADDGAYTIDTSYCTADPGYVLAGYTFSFGAGGSDLYLITTDRNGLSCISRDVPMAEGSACCQPNYVEPCEPRWHTQCNIEVDYRPVFDWSYVCNWCWLANDPGDGAPGLSGGRDTLGIPNVHMPESAWRAEGNRGSER